MAQRLFNMCPFKNLITDCFQRSTLILAQPMSSQNLNKALLKLIKEKENMKKEDKEEHARRYNKPKLRFLLQGIDLDHYTHKPLPYPKSGGRDIQGRISNRRSGGGFRQRYRMVDFTRNAISEEKPLQERVLQVRYDPLRSADIALVASQNKKRWIIAGQKMKAGDVISSYSNIPKIPVSAKAGDAHPVGALPVGTAVHNLEIHPKEGGSIARAAGTSGVILSKDDVSVVVKMPSKREVRVSKECICTVGKASGYAKPIGSARRSRWLGIRPSSGLRQKKSGYHGRRNRAVKPMVSYVPKTKSLQSMFD